MAMRSPACVVAVALGACSVPVAGGGADSGDVSALRVIYSGPPSTWPAPHVDPGVEFVELARVPDPVFPDHNPWSEEKETLGRALFFDARLSGTGQMACATCHDAELGWGDGRATSFGHGFQPLARNAPTVLNAAFGSSFFWDGRAASLEDQALAVFENPSEMHSSAEQVVGVLARSRGYRELFGAAFGDEEPTIERALQAIATFERTIASDGSSAFDAFLRGDADALSDAAVRGLHLFRTKARCVNCHHGPLLTDGNFHDLGLSYYGRKLQDLGRYEVTKDPADVGSFKTPSLRNVSRTAPYMHNGLFNLRGIVNMYDAGMPSLERKPEQEDDPLFPIKSPLLKPLDLTGGEKADLLAFLESLTERRRRVRARELPQLDDIDFGSGIVRLSWLAGSWASRTGDAFSEEHWTAPAGGVMVGMHRDVRGERSFFEYLRIEQRGEVITYVASPAGRPATRFTLTECGPGRVVFENLDHDFPQRIVYRLGEDGALRAAISDAAGGRRQEWVWLRSDLRAGAR